MIDFSYSVNERIFLFIFEISSFKSTLWLLADTLPVIQGNIFAISLKKKKKILCLGKLQFLIHTLSLEIRYNLVSNYVNFFFFSVHIHARPYRFNFFFLPCNCYSMKKYMISCDCIYIFVYLLIFLPLVFFNLLLMQIVWSKFLEYHEVKWNAPIILMLYGSVPCTQLPRGVWSDQRCTVRFCQWSIQTAHWQYVP